MAFQYSFSNYEKDYSHDYRKRITTAEDGVDVSKTFSHTMVAMLNDIFDNKFDLKDPDIIFDPTEDKHFRFSDRIRVMSGFNDVLTKSDLTHILERFAYTANNRYKHLNKHPEKTNAKIRN
jgi:hypothetical protein